MLVRPAVSALFLPGWRNCAHQRSMLGALKGSASRGGSWVLHILVIEDDSDLRITVQEALQAEGYKVSVAADGAQGIALQRTEPASLLITDIFMPNMEGIETIRDLRKNFPTCQSLLFRGAAAG